MNNELKIVIVTMMATIVIGFAFLTPKTTLPPQEDDSDIWPAMEEPIGYVDFCGEGVEYGYGQLAVYFDKESSLTKEEQLEQAKIKANKDCGDFYKRELEKVERFCTENRGSLSWEDFKMCERRAELSTPI